MIAEPIRSAAFIAFFEAFQPVAKWDVNAFRLGYGSDTEGPQGVPVVDGMTTTKDRASSNLRMRLPIFEWSIIRQIGAPAYSRLGPGSQCAILSFEYNYGRLLAGVMAAAIGGQPMALAAALMAREFDNKGINAKRRFAEAAMAASDGG